MNEFKIDKINSDKKILFIDVPNADKTVAIVRNHKRIFVAFYPMSKITDKPIKSILCLDAEGYNADNDNGGENESIVT